MLRLLFTLPAAGAVRALADGSSGTLGAGSVGAYELRPGAVALDRLGALPAGHVIGRPAGADGAPQALDAAALRDLLGEGAADLTAGDLAEAQALTPTPAARSLDLLGRFAPGDGGGALYVRSGGEPAHPGKLQTADGAWWEMSAPFAAPEAFGAAGSGAGDDSAAFAAAAAWSTATGGAVVGRPGASYRLSATAACPGGRFEGRGAEILFAGPADAAVLRFAEGAAGVEVRGWRARLTRTSHFFVRGTRFEGVRIEANEVLKGCLFECDLDPSAPGYTGASWGPSKPDVNALSEADLSRDVIVADNVCLGDDTAPDGAGGLEVIRLRYLRGALVAGNTLRGYGGESPGRKISGIFWWGGDSNPDRDGGLGSVRWARDIRVVGNLVSRCSSGGIWGSQGRDVVCTGNLTEECGDIGIHGEGSDGITVTGNVMRDCRNGGFCPFFVEERAVYADNSVTVTDAAAWGDVLAKHNMGYNTGAYEILFSGNALEMQDPSVTGRLVLQRDATVRVEGNTLRDVAIAADTPNAESRVIRGNHLMFTRDPGMHGISVGRLRAPAGSRGAGAVVEDNLIEAWGWDAASTIAAIRVLHAGVDADQEPFVLIRGNRIQGWRDGGAAKGFAADVITESLNFTGRHVTEIQGNRLWKGVIVDLTDGRGASVFPQRIKHLDNLSGDPERLSPYDDAPRGGVFLRGSRGLRDAPGAGGHEGWIAVGSALTAGAADGAWSSGVDYAFPDHVSGSDGAVYAALAPSGPGAGGAVDPISGDAGRWRRVAPVQAQFKGRGAIEG